MVQSKFPKVSILILNWNGKRYIDKIFSSISKLNYPKDKIEILFIDNASSDDSVRYFLSKSYKNARLIETGGNYGYAGGNNYGFKEAAGDYIVVCNNDLEFDRLWLKNLIETALDTDADVVVPKIIYAKNNIINNAGSTLVPDSDWPNSERGMGESVSNKKFNDRSEVTAFCGASPLFKRSFLQEVGLYDPLYFLYWEDTDLSWRGQKKGKKYIYEPSSIAYHDTSGSTGGETSSVFIYYVSRNRVLILVKNGKFRYALKATLKVFRDHVVYKIIDLLIALGKRRGRKSALKGFLLGIKIQIGIAFYTPVMLLKRVHLVKEEALEK